MIKAIFLLKRKDGITHEQFREHYEKSHAKLGQKYFGHLLISYERNYVTQVRASRSQGLRPASFDYDCITEWILRDEAALAAVYDVFKIPEIGKEFFDDEGRFLDRDAVTSIICTDDDVINTGTGGGHGTLERQ